MIIFRDWSIWFIDNFMKMLVLNRKYPNGTAKRRRRAQIQAPKLLIVAISV